MKKKAFLIFFLFPFTLFAFPSKVEIDGQSVKRIGHGEYYYMGLLKVFSAAYYTNASKPERLAEEPFTLILEYHRSITAKEFHKITSEGIRQRLSKNAFQKMKSTIDRFNHLYKNVKKGDRYTLSYSKETITLLLNNKALGSIQDKAFSKALLSIWLGNPPMSKKLKKKLLAK